MSVRAISKSSRIAVALLASVAVAATAVATDALAARGGGGGGHGGGGGFHGGGGGFHGGGGGGGFRMGGGGFHSGGGGFHGFAAHGISHGFAGHAAGHAFAGRSFGGHTFVGHGHAARLATDGIAATHNAIAPHLQSGANQLNARGEFAHNQSVHNQFVHNQLAHNQFVARNFRGLYNFNHTGFNRNAFGDPSRWNRSGRPLLGRRLESLGLWVGRLGRPGFLAVS